LWSNQPWDLAKERLEQSIEKGVLMPTQNEKTVEQKT
jgi:hypothetical protein